MFLGQILASRAMPRSTAKEVLRRVKAAIQAKARANLLPLERELLEDQPSLTLEFQSWAKAATRALGKDLLQQQEKDLRQREARVATLARANEKHQGRAMKAKATATLRLERVAANPCTHLLAKALIQILGKAATHLQLLARATIPVRAKEATRMSMSVVEQRLDLHQMPFSTLGLYQAGVEQDGGGSCTRKSPASPARHISRTTMSVSTTVNGWQSTRNHHPSRDLRPTIAAVKEATNRRKSPFGYTQWRTRSRFCSALRVQERRIFWSTRSMNRRMLERNRSDSALYDKQIDGCECISHNTKPTKAHDFLIR